MYELALFAGAGGGALASGLLGFRIVGYVENERACHGILISRILDGSLDPAPIFGNVRRFNADGFAASYTGLVDIVSGGFPCQDISNAGKRAGIGGRKSGLWGAMRDTIGIVRPRYVFIENVGALVRRGLHVVLGDLHACGYDAEWDCFRASDVGAPHRRERIFILALSILPGERGSVRSANRRGADVSGLQGDRRRDDLGSERISNAVGHALRDEPKRGDDRTQAAEQGDAKSRHMGRAMVDAASLGRGEGIAQTELWSRRDPASKSSRAVVDAISEGCEQHSRAGAIRAPLADAKRSNLWPPGPQDLDGWAAYVDAGGPKPAICRSANGVARRVDRLRAIGNGQVPIVAARAFVTLARRFEE